MATKRYAALLRGINVGGRNIVSMAELRDAFASAGYESVSTYIQSGNVIFESDAPRDSLEPEIEQLLEHRFGVSLVVVVRSHRQLRNVVANAPAGFGATPETRLCDVVFLKSPLSAAQAMRAVELREGVDRAWPGTGVVYFERVKEDKSRSRMSRIVAKPEYKQMTIRNWATTTTLADRTGDAED